MAVRNDFTAGEVLAAADLNDTFASKLPYSYGTATPSTTDSGFLWYDSNSTPAAPKFWDGSAFQALTSGKILQVVRATDSTNRTTTSTSFVDASLSVTITPQKSTSAIVLLWSVNIGSPNSGGFGFLQISDNSNNAISGAEGSNFSDSDAFIRLHALMVGYSTPASTSAQTYKARFRVSAGEITLINGNSTGQLYAFEVSA